jgi:hypothetical protein
MIKVIEITQTTGGKGTYYNRNKNEKNVRKNNHKLKIRWSEKNGHDLV